MIVQKNRNKNENENKFYIDINLSFFEGDKTEQPTSRKKTKAREEGQVAQSKEVGTAFVFICGFLTLKVFAGYIYDKCQNIYLYMFELIGDIDRIFTIDYLSTLVVFIFSQILLICLPILGVIFIASLVSNIIQVGWHPTAKPLMPKLSNFNPVSGFKRIISVKSLVELVKSLVKLGIIGSVIISSLKNEVNTIQTLLLMDLMSAFIYIGNLCISIGIKVGIFFIGIAMADYAYQKYRHLKKLKMTKQEVKDEYKSTEGDPHIKGKIKQKMREVSMRRMMQEVPNADVIITNPTHYAVAIKYDKNKAAAPIVIAKGVDHLARRIKELAKSNKVEIVENRPLARALYNTVDVGREIPPELYQAVAEVLAFVYRLKNVL